MHLTYLICVAMSLCTAATSGKQEPVLVKANDYLMKKWRSWQTMDDIDHDGYLSLEDLKIMKQNFAYRGVSGDTISTLEKIWRTILLGGHSKLSSDEFAQMMKEKYESNQTKFVKTLQKLNSEWFKVIDVNKDGFLSLDEYVMDMEAFRRENTKKNEDFYYSHRLVDNVIPLDEVGDVWLRFETEADMSKTDIIVVAVESGF